MSYADFFEKMNSDGYDKLYQEVNKKEEICNTTKLPCAKCNPRCEHRVVKDRQNKDVEYQELNKYKRKIARLKELKEKEPDNIYHDWDAEIAQQESNIVQCVLDSLLV